MKIDIQWEETDNHGVLSLVKGDTIPAPDWMEQKEMFHPVQTFIATFKIKRGAYKEAENGYSDAWRRHSTSAYWDFQDLHKGSSLALLYEVKGRLRLEGDDLVTILRALRYLLADRETLTLDSEDNAG